ncbi:hypothetical protein SKAU_G00228440 [Synaphobranchus kaupii]|uniref:Uncharacterized protein n=1 Tax=Synaphobranchus kaupii TaxID=118154 RepID=A0A9Q1IQY9_SYNKA|nr:hypothetical protein SKAU_G00228440 [Synaphobranchus kaupii]
MQREERWGDSGVKSLVYTTDVEAAARSHAHCVCQKRTQSQWRGPDADLLQRSFVARLFCRRASSCLPAKELHLARQVAQTQCTGWSETFAMPNSLCGGVCFLNTVPSHGKSQLQKRHR